MLIGITPSVTFSKPMKEREFKERSRRVKEESEAGEKLTKSTKLNGKEMVELKDLLVLDLPYATGFRGALLSLICNHII